VEHVVYVNRETIGDNQMALNKEGKGIDECEEWQTGEKKRKGREKS